MKGKGYWLLVVLTVVCGLIGGALSNWMLTARKAEAVEPVAENWSDKPAELTIKEYFELLFNFHFNDKQFFDVDDELYIGWIAMPIFLHGESPDNAIVLLEQFWGDLMLMSDPDEGIWGKVLEGVKKRVIFQKTSDTYLSQFEGLCKRQGVSKRWPALAPRSQLIIRGSRTVAAIRRHKLPYRIGKAFIASSYSSATSDRAGWRNS